MRTLAMTGVMVLALLALTGCSGDSGSGLPQELPFTVERADVGEPLTTAEAESFTADMTKFWNDVEYFQWLWLTGHGLHESYNPAMPDYMIHWQDTTATKSGDTVTFLHVGGADNLMIDNPKIITAVGSAYLLTGDEKLAKIATQHIKGISAFFLGYIWGNENPVVTGLLPRAIFTQDHSYTTDGGRKVVVSYAGVREEKIDWNANTIHNPANPTYGDIWVRNERSKDDVPHIFRVVPFLQRLMEDAKDPDLIAAAAEAHANLKAFTKDIVDTGYFIRAKNSNGEVYIPTIDGGGVKDLASFVNFEQIMPNAECNSKLNAALLAYGQPLDNDCGVGISETYESVSTSVHYYNFAIIRYFHVAAVHQALAAGHYDVAENLMQGLMQRADEDMHNTAKRNTESRWDTDLASWLLAAASAGMPLTSEEKRLIRTLYTASMAYYRTWPNWDLWDATVPDGSAAWVPPENADGHAYISAEEMAAFMELCYSPYVDRDNIADLINCDKVADKASWGL